MSKENKERRRFEGREEKNERIYALGPFVLGMWEKGKRELQGLGIQRKKKPEPGKWRCIYITIPRT